MSNNLTAEEWDCILEAYDIITEAYGCPEFAKSWFYSMNGYYDDNAPIMIIEKTGFCKKRLLWAARDA